jgi:hypothetical protein
VPTNVGVGFPAFQPVPVRRAFQSGFRRLESRQTGRQKCLPRLRQPYLTGQLGNSVSGPPPLQPRPQHSVAASKLGRTPARDLVKIRNTIMNIYLLLSTYYMILSELMIKVIMYPLSLDTKVYQTKHVDATTAGTTVVVHK